MIKRKKVCTCRDTDIQVDESNAKEIWVTTSWKYDKYAKRTVPYWRKIDDTKMEPYQIMDGLVEIAVFDHKKKNTEQNFYADKEQLLQTINKIAVKRP